MRPLTIRRPRGELARPEPGDEFVSAADFAELRAQLQEALETIEAIRAGDVDALVIGPPGEERLYTLTSADRTYRLLVDGMNEGAATVSSSGVILYANARLGDMVGRVPTRLVGTDALELARGADRAALARLLDSGGDDRATADLELATADGGRLPVLVSVSRVDLDGTLVRVVVATDVAGVREAEREVIEAHHNLQRSEALLRETQAVAHVGGWELDVLDDRLRWTDETYRIHETSPAEYTPTVPSAIGFYAPESIPRISAAVRDAIEHGTPYDLELELITARGRRIWVRATCTATVDAQGRTTKLAGAFQDISERRAADAALRESEERFRSVVEGSPDAMVLTGLDDLRIRDVNPAGCALLGCPDDELIGKHISEVVPPADQAAQAGRVDALRAGRFMRTEVRMLRPHGAPFDAEIAHVVLADGRILSTIRDISDRKRAEAERTHLLAAIEHAPDPLMLVGLDGRIVYANHALEEVSGHARVALTGSLPAIFGGPGHTSLPPEVWQGILAGRPWTGEIPALRSDGGTFTLEWTIAPVSDEAGTALGYIASARDRSVEKALQAQLAQSQRLEAVGELAGGIAHDFNNLLTAIRGYAQLIQRGLGADDPARADVEQVIDAADRAAALTRGLLAFSRRQVLAPRVLDPAEVVEGIAPLLRQLLGAHIELSTAVTPGGGHVRVDPSQLEQVIVNLAVNARDAMPEGGQLMVELRDVELDAAYVATHPEATVGPHVLLAVSDTGIGMDAATQARIFEPFFTTKETGRGTGMGLATVYGIVKQSGGSIYVYSEPGHGTTFRVYFPRVAGRPGPAAAEPIAVRPSAAGSETILLVEDEAAVRGFARRTLEAQGYTVLEAGSGAEALALAAARAGIIDLLVTDVVMPGLQGHRLAEQLTVVRPGLRVLYVSGFTENSVIHHGVAAEGIAFLAKPFSADALGQAVRAALDRPA